MGASEFGSYSGWLLGAVFNPPGIALLCDRQASWMLPMGTASGSIIDTRIVHSSIALMRETALPADVLG